MELLVNNVPLIQIPKLFLGTSNSYLPAVVMKKKNASIPNWVIQIKRYQILICVLHVMIL